jgi:hypothetical protein
LTVCVIGWNLVVWLCIWFQILKHMLILFLICKQVGSSSVFEWRTCGECTEVGKTIAWFPSKRGMVQIVVSFCQIFIYNVLLSRLTSDGRFIFWLQD